MVKKNFKTMRSDLRGQKRKNGGLRQRKERHIEVWLGQFGFGRTDTLQKKKERDSRGKRKKKARPVWDLRRRGKRLWGLVQQEG